jgi:hypothetical protein
LDTVLDGPQIASHEVDLEGDCEQIQWAEVCETASARSGSLGAAAAGHTPLKTTGRFSGKEWVILCCFPIDRKCPASDPVMVRLPPFAE